MKPRGYLTQCAQWDCGKTVRLPKPAKWYCPEHEVSAPKPTAPM